MKKLFTMLFILVTGVFASYAQTLVTTQPLNKNIVLENYTGIHCVYCPEGHAIAKSILDNNPGRAVVVAIHQGSFAVPNAGEPDYRTSFGDALAGQTGLSGYPSGTVNRHVFSGTSTALGRGDWVASSNVILQQPSPVNVGIETTFNNVSRQLTVHVELYYTANSATSPNYINVALLQDHIFGPQTGGGAGNNYEHMHMLRHLITGQWGDPVTPTTQGTLIEKTYNYTVPDNYNNVSCVVSNCQVAVFVTQGHQEVLSGDVVNAIDGTNLWVGDISTADSTMKLGTPGSITPFSLVANSNLAGTEQFKIKLVSDSPSDWSADFVIDGQTYSDSAMINLVKGTPKNIELNVTPGTSAGFQTYTFEMSSVNNPNAPTKYFKVYVLSNVTTLLVNAAGDANATLHQGVYINGLIAAGSDENAVMKSDVFLKASNAGILTDVLNIFYNVAWTFPAFTDPEAVAVKAFVDNGGNLFAAGQDIGWDIMSGQSGSHGTPEAQDLYTNYLKAQYIDDGNTTSNKLIANPSDSIFGTVATSNVIDVYGGYMYPDQIAPLQNASTIFYYNPSFTKICAIRSTKDEAKVVYFGIGLEMVQTESVRNDIINRALDWFMEGVGIKENNSHLTPSLSQNAPNPCSDETVIRFSVPAVDRVSLKVYDLTGKEVMQLINNETLSGPRQVNVPTANLGPGIYYYMLQTSSGKLARKMIVVR